MTQFTRTYRTGRLVLWGVTLMGWLFVGVGLITVIVGLRWLLSMAGAPATSALLGPLANIGSGFGIILLGLFGIAGAQQTRATFDLADMTREMLALARRPPQGSGRATPVLPGPAEAQSAPTGPSAPRTGRRAEAVKPGPIFSARPPK